MKNDKYNSDLTNKINTSTSKKRLGAHLLWFIQKALPQNDISIYEAFQLMEMSSRYRNSSRSTLTTSHIVESINLALLSKLFDEEAMYKQFCIDAKEKCNIWHKYLKERNEWFLPKDSHYILDDLDGFLSGDLEHMEQLSYKRAHTHRNSQKEFPYHWSVFPYDDFKYEDELIKILKGETDRYEIDKTISPEICQMMIDIELRVDDVS